MNRNWQGITIITAAILTSMPRWIIALLAGEGIVVPEEWRATWIIISAILAASMAVVEGAAFAYIFRAWRSQSGKSADILLYLAIASAIAFVFTLSPSMAASVRGISMGEYIKSDYLLLFWTTSVVLSTILVVISVGYSEKVVNVDPKLQKARQELREARADIKRLDAELGKSSEWKWLSNGTSKKEKVQVATEKWPELPNKSIATILDTSENYVSQNRSKRNI